jgi:hypothetical protein
MSEFEWFDPHASLARTDEPDKCPRAKGANPAKAHAESAPEHIICNRRLPDQLFSEIPFEASSLECARVRKHFAEHDTRPMFDDIRGAALLERRRDVWTDTLEAVYRGELCLVFDCDGVLSAFRRSLP